MAVTEKIAHQEVEKFKDTEEAISLHGLGFLQVRLGGKQRLHVWHPELPRRSCYVHSAIHDHRFSFESRILVGSMANEIYAATKPTQFLIATHTTYLHEGERSRFGNRPWAPDEKVIMAHVHSSEFKAGDKYTMPAFMYHATVPLGDGRVATLMTKTDEDKEKGAHSTCRIGIRPDVNFDRKQMREDDMWAIVRDVLGSTP